jgi:hypothetical protein
VPKGCPALRLQVALVEERVRHSGGNGIRFQLMVVRKLAGDGAGLPLPAMGVTKANVTFDAGMPQPASDGLLCDSLWLPCLLIARDVRLQQANSPAGRAGPSNASPHWGCYLIPPLS